jgi:hypothetical protein
LEPKAKKVPVVPTPWSLSSNGAERNEVGVGVASISRGRSNSCMAKQTPSAVTGTGVFHVRQAGAEYEAARFGTPAVLAWGGQCHPPFHGLARLEGMLPSLGPHKAQPAFHFFFWHWCRPANRFCTMDRIKPASKFKRTAHLQPSRQRDRSHQESDGQLTRGVKSPTGVPGRPIKGACGWLQARSLAWQLPLAPGKRVGASSSGCLQATFSSLLFSLSWPSSFVYG